MSDCAVCVCGGGVQWYCCCAAMLLRCQSALLLPLVVKAGCAWRSLQQVSPAAHGHLACIRRRYAAAARDAEGARELLGSCERKYASCHPQHTAGSAISMQSSPVLRRLQQVRAALRCSLRCALRCWWASCFALWCMVPCSRLHLPRWQVGLLCAHVGFCRPVTVTVTVPF